MKWIVSLSITIIVAVILLIPSNAISSEELELGNLKSIRVVGLKGELDHVQGIDVDDERVWVTSVNRKAKTGHLHVFNAMNGKLINQAQIHEGERYHPGGLMADGSALWIPVATYTRQGNSTIERRDKKTLKLLNRFFVDDHIGCVAVDGDRLIGGNWDARDIYVWDKTGKQIKRMKNPSRARYQDMKFAGGFLIASGLLEVRGTIDWLRLDSLELARRIQGDKTDRGVCYMNEGMATRAGKLYLLPEDGPSRLFVFQLDLPDD